jgi:hypothetical protein
MRRCPRRLGPIRFAGIVHDVVPELLEPARGPRTHVSGAVVAVSPYMRLGSVTGVIVLTDGHDVETRSERTSLPAIETSGRHAT